MKAAGMVPLTLSAADMKALVSYVSGLGGATTGAAAAPPARGLFHRRQLQPHQLKPPPRRKLLLQRQQPREVRRLWLAQLQGRPYSILTAATNATARPESGPLDPL